MKIEGYTFHELTQKVPEMSPADFRLLKADIQKTGQSMPIYKHGDLIIDGRNRLKACLELGIEPWIEEYKGGKTIAQFILSTNIRRNLSKLQRQQMLADFAPIVFPEIEAETKERQKSKPGRTSFVKENSPSRNRRHINPARAAFEQQTGASEWESRQLKTILERAPDLLPQVTKLGGLNKVHEQAKARPRSKKPKSKPDKTTMRQRREAVLNGLPPFRGLTKEEVDPNFKGTAQDFVDKYGHVQLLTKEQIEKANDQAAFSAWVAVFRNLKGPLSDYLKLGKFNVENYHKFIAKAGNKERRIGEMKELADMVVRTKESIGWLLEELSHSTSQVS